jgi:hypothetical protein
MTPEQIQRARHGARKWASTTKSASRKHLTAPGPATLPPTAPQPSWRGNHAARRELKPRVRNRLARVAAAPEADAGDDDGPRCAH